MRAAYFSPSASHQPPLLVGRQPVGVVPELRLVDADDLRILLRRPAVRRPSHWPSFVVGTERVELVVVEAADRVPLHRLAAAGIDEDENRAAARRVGGDRRHRAKHRVVVVFARHDDPHVDALARHQRGNTVSNRFGIQPLTSGACSRCVSTRCVGIGIDWSVLLRCRRIEHRQPDDCDRRRPKPKQPGGEAGAGIRAALHRVMGGV